MATVNSVAASVAAEIDSLRNDVNSAELLDDFQNEMEAVRNDVLHVQQQLQEQLQARTARQADGGGVRQRTARPPGTQ